jgi:hypothetical protein
MMTRKEKDDYTKHAKIIAAQYKLINGATWLFVSLYLKQTVLININ